MIFKNDIEDVNVEMKEYKIVSFDDIEMVFSDGENSISISHEEYKQINKVVKAYKKIEKVNSISLSD